MEFLYLFIEEKWQKVQPVQAHIALKRLSSAFGDLPFLGRVKGLKQVGN